MRAFLVEYTIEGVNRNFEQYVQAPSKERAEVLFKRHHSKDDIVVQIHNIRDDGELTTITELFKG